MHASPTIPKPPWSFNFRLVRPLVWLTRMTLLAIVPLWAFAWPPSVDWPRHVLGIDFLARLLQGDAAIAECYEIALQPVGYHVFYLLAVPLALWCGAPAALKVMMSATLAAHVAVCTWASVRRGGPMLLGLVGIPMFYGSHYTWGFVVSLLAAPLACVPLAWLVQDTAAARSPSPHPASAALWTALAGLTHAVFASFVAAAALVALALRGQAAWPVAKGVLAGAALVTVPGIATRLAMAITAGEANRDWHATFLEGWEMVVEAACGIDSSLALFGLVATLAILAAAAGAPATRGPSVAVQLAPPRSGRHSDRALCGAMACLYIGLVWALPYKTRGPIGATYLVNVRALALLPFVGVLAAAQSHLWRAAKLRAAALIGLSVATALTLVGVWLLSTEYELETTSWVRAIERIPAGARFAATSQNGFVGSAAPPLLLGIPSMAATRQLRRTNLIFLGAQLPLRGKSTCDSCGLEPSLVDAVQLLTSDASSDSTSEALWQRADVAFVQRTGLPSWREPYPQEATVWARGPHWQLWGPPSACFLPHSWYDPMRVYACE